MSRTKFNKRHGWSWVRSLNSASFVARKFLGPTLKVKKVLRNTGDGGGGDGPRAAERLSGAQDGRIETAASTLPDGYSERLTGAVA